MINIGESIYDLTNDKTTIYDAAMKFTEDVGMIFDPVTGGSAIKLYPTLGEENLKMMAQGIAPDPIIKPLVQIAINQTWNGANIYPDYEMDALPKNRYYNTVNPIYVKMA